MLQAQHGLKASRSPVKKVLMLRPPTSQTLSDLAALQNEKAHLSQQMKQVLFLYFDELLKHFHKRMQRLWCNTMSCVSVMIVYVI